LDSPRVNPGTASEVGLKIDHVVSWDNFASFVESRLKSNPKLVFYVDGAGQTGGMSGRISNPPGMAAVENPHLLWQNAIR
jgi:hypothetical protein